MPVAVDFFLHYGYVLLFVWVMAEQLGLPIPSIPLLIAAGTISATSPVAHGQRMSIWLMFLAVLAACAVSDTIWYRLGKRYGQSVIRMLCKLSLETDSCVRRTEDIFSKRGPVALLFAKFMPGLNTVAAPIAGESGMPYLRFIAWDMAGAALWSGTFLIGGRFFGDELKHHPELWSWAGRSAGVLFVAAILGFLLYRVLKQRRFLKQVRNARLEPNQLKDMLDNGKDVVIVDLRHPLDYLPDPRTIPGALRILPDELIKRSQEIPRDKDIVLFCTCPSEQTSGKVALQMRKLGIYRVRPLRGGFEGWRDRGFPLVEFDSHVPAQGAESAHAQAQAGSTPVQIAVQS